MGQPKEDGSIKQKHGTGVVPLSHVTAKTLYRDNNFVPNTETGGQFLVSQCKTTIESHHCGARIIPRALTARCYAHIL